MMYITLEDRVGKGKEKKDVEVSIQLEIGMRIRSKEDVHRTAAQLKQISGILKDKSVDRHQTPRAHFTIYLPKGYTHTTRGVTAKAYGSGELGITCRLEKYLVYYDAVGTRLPEPFTKVDVIVRDNLTNSDGTNNVQKMVIDKYREHIKEFLLDPDNVDMVVMTVLAEQIELGREKMHERIGEAQACLDYIDMIEDEGVLYE